eukprot:TRINITY_DN65939_c0_g1_i7.p2 TRINITY_DN65939_c0_g1~~TRINITY_DN65939_c0_g1_i7.p2  ORF type:complete len:409 (+),score=151.81 TRINITY_DN65939_c0_g1_i7:27-1229(+)
MANIAHENLVGSLHAVRLFAHQLRDMRIIKRLAVKSIWSRCADVFSVLAMVGGHHVVGDDHLDDAAGSCALLIALKYGARIIALSLVQHHSADITVKDSFGGELWLCAAQYGLGDVLDAMIACDDKAAVDTSRALMVACGGGHAQLALHLMREHGADVEAVDQWGYTALMWAAQGGFADVVDAVMAHGGEAVLNHQNRDGRTALFLACFERKANVALMLVNKYGADVTVVNKDGETALWMSADRGFVGVVDAIMSRGGEKVLDQPSRRDGSTPLMIACSRRRADVALMLINKYGTDVTVADKCGHTALSVSAYRGLVDVIDAIMAHGGEKVLDLPNRRGITPLACACSGQQADAALMLINKYGADVTVADSYGYTALLWSAERGLVDVVDAVNAKNGPNC